MSESSPRRSFAKRLFIAVSALAAFTMASVIGARMAVESLFKGIASSRSTGLSAFAWDVASMWSGGGMDGVYRKGVADPWIARSAGLRARSSAFDRSLVTLHQVVSTHHGYLEDLRTESRSGYGRALAATVSVPSSEFDATLADLKTLGRVEGISEAGEDFRRQTRQLRDAVALEKDIAQANESVNEAERQNQGLLSTVAQAHIHFTLLEDYRAPLQANLAGFFLQLRNSLVEGVSSIFSSAALVLGVLFEFGLPLLFWAALLFIPARLAWRRFRRAPTTAPAVP